MIQYHTVLYCTVYHCHSHTHSVSLSLQSTGEYYVDSVCIL
jgi:hypothetical protein